MLSSDKNLISNYDTNPSVPYIPQNKKYYLSFINNTNTNINLSPNKLKIFNLINKKDFTYSTNSNTNNMNEKQKANKILDKFLMNQAKKGKMILFKRNDDLSIHSNNLTNNDNNTDNIFLDQMTNKSKPQNHFNKSCNANHNQNNNENKNSQQTNILEKTKKINFALESHQLLNSLLKNQTKNNNKNVNTGKVITNPFEISFSSSNENNINSNILSKNKIEISSPSKDSIEINSITNSNTNTNNNYNYNQNVYDSLSKNLNFEYWNKNREHMYTYNSNNKENIDKISYNNNIYFGLNKENDDYNFPEINFFNNNIDDRNNKFSNSPLRMADVFMLKKHHSIYPNHKPDINNYVDSITFNNKNIKKIIFIKPKEQKIKSNEMKNEDEIKEIGQKENTEIINEEKEIKDLNDSKINNISSEIKEEEKEEEKEKENEKDNENKKKKQRKSYKEFKEEKEKIDKRLKERRSYKEIKEDNGKIEEKEKIKKEEKEKKEKEKEIKTIKNKNNYMEKKEEKGKEKEDNNLKERKSFKELSEEKERTDKKLKERRSYKEINEEKEKEKEDKKSKEKKINMEIIEFKDKEIDDGNENKYKNEKKGTKIKDIENIKIKEIGNFKGNEENEFDKNINKIKANEGNTERNKKCDIIIRKRNNISYKNKENKDEKEIDKKLINKNINKSNNKNINLKERKNDMKNTYNNNEKEISITITNEGKKNNIRNSHKEMKKINIEINKISNNIAERESSISPRNNYKDNNSNNYLSNIKKEEEERPQIHSIRRRFMNSKNKYNNFTPDIELRKNNIELSKESKINAYIKNSNSKNEGINKSKYIMAKSFENIKKEELFKINISRINNKESIDKSEDNISLGIETDVQIKRNSLRIKREIKRVSISPIKEIISKSPNRDEIQLNKKNKKIENNNKDNISYKNNRNKKNNTNIFSDDEKNKEEEKEKINERKKEEEENILNKKKFQSESEKEKRMRRARKFLQKEDRNKENKENNNKDEDKIDLEKKYKKIEENAKKEEKTKNKIRNSRSKDKIYVKAKTNLKEKNFSSFSMQNLFGIKMPNKNHSYKERYEFNKNINQNEKEKEENDSNKKNTNNTSVIFSSNLNENQNFENIKANKEIINNEEDIKIIKENSESNGKFQRKKRRFIPRQYKTKRLSAKLNEIKIKDNNPINNEEINNNEYTNENNENNSKRKIKILEDVIIEEIDTTKPVVQINILTQILLKDKPYKNIYLYGFDKKNNFFVQFDLRKKKFLRIKIADIEDLSDSFEKEYIYQNTIVYNILIGAFILTGKNSNILYFYNSLNETMTKICEFNNNHNSGSLLLEQENNRILIFGGKNSIFCESYSFETNGVKELPNLNFDRSNASFIISGNKIFGFFGFSFKKGKYLFNIEYIDKNELDKWNIIKLNFESKKDLMPFHLKNISTYIYDKNPGKIIIYGGKQGRNETIMDCYYYIYDVDKNSFVKIDEICFNIIKDIRGINIWKKSEMIEFEDKKGFFFDKEKHFTELPEEDKFDGHNKNICGIIDSECNVHFLTNNQRNINVYKFAK